MRNVHRQENLLLLLVALDEQPGVVPEDELGSVHSHVLEGLPLHGARQREEHH
jgi:hypothetical protein